MDWAWWTCLSSCPTWGWGRCWPLWPGRSPWYRSGRAQPPQVLSGPPDSCLLSKSVRCPEGESTRLIRKRFRFVFPDRWNQNRQAESTNPKEQLYGLGASGACGSTGDVLSDDSEAALVLLAATIVLVRTHTTPITWIIRLLLFFKQAQLVIQWVSWWAYLGKGVFTAPIKSVSSPIKGDVVSVSIDRACAMAQVVSTLPFPVFTCARGGKQVDFELDTNIQYRDESLLVELLNSQT